MVGRILQTCPRVVMYIGRSLGRTRMEEWVGSYNERQAGGSLRDTPLGRLPETVEILRGGV